MPNHLNLLRKCSEALKPFVELADKRDARYRKRGGDPDAFPDTHPAYDISANELKAGAFRQARELSNLCDREIAGEGESEEVDPLFVDLRERIDGVIEFNGCGFWRSCSGCYESEDGHPVGDYPFSRILGCALGGGCSECGGIGATFDPIDYEEMARDMLAEDSAEKPEAPAEAAEARLTALEQALATTATALNAFIEMVGKKDCRHGLYGWKRFPKFDEVQAAMEANNGAAALLSTLTKGVSVDK